MVQILHPDEELLSRDALDATVAGYPGHLYAMGATQALGRPEESLIQIPSEPYDQTWTRFRPDFDLVVI